MERLENGWLARGKNRTVDYKMYCHNTKCDLFAKPQVRPGYYESDTGWGEADDDECTACLEPLYYYEPAYFLCERCEEPVLEDDMNTDDRYCQHCYSDLFESWQAQVGKDRQRGIE
jgi:hypothetical protein